MKKVFVLLFAVLMSCSGSDDPNEDNSLMLPSISVVNQHLSARVIQVKILGTDYDWQGFDHLYKGDSRTFVLNSGIDLTMNPIILQIRFGCGSANKGEASRNLEVTDKLQNGKTTVINVVSRPDTLGCDYFDLEIGS